MPCVLRPHINKPPGRCVSACASRQSKQFPADTYPAPRQRKPNKGRNSSGTATDARKQTDTFRPAASSADRGVRINKCLKHKYSRRQVDALIDAGSICINNHVAAHGDRIHPGDKVTCEGEHVHWELLNVDAVQTGEFIYVKYWKPAGVTCTTDRSIPGNIIDEIAHPKRIFPVGRLDRDSTGLILLTNNGAFVNALLRSAHARAKRYIVKVNRALHSADVRELAAGVTITTEAQRDRGRKTLTAPTLPCNVSQMSAYEFEIELVEGRNRQIRKMCEALGYRVTGLHRIDVAGIGMTGLKPGQWRAMSSSELKVVDAVLKEAYDLHT